MNLGRGLMVLGVVYSLSLMFVCPSVSAQSDGETTRVSVSSSGQQGDDTAWHPSISADGRYIAFSSYAKNLIPNDTNNYQDIFVHDRQTRQTTRVSVSSSGQQSNADSAFAAISADGRYVTFQSPASNLIANDFNNDQDIFVHDRLTAQTTRVSVSSSGQEGNNSSYGPSISADGRYIAFASDATNFVLGDTAWADTFVHDRQTGQTTKVSVNSSGEPGNFQFSTPTSSISADGRYIAFDSGGSNLVTNDTNGLDDIFVHDRVMGQTTRVSVASNGTQANNASYFPAISGDGRYVAFRSHASNLVSDDTNGHNDIFVHDRNTGQTRRVSVSSSGQQSDGLSDSLAISADGRYIAFESDAGNLVSGDTDYSTNVFVHDLQTGQTVRVSVSSSGQAAAASCGVNYNYGLSISGNGQYVAFESYAGNLVADDTNNRCDIFVRDRWPAVASPPNAAPVRTRYPTLTPLLTWGRLPHASGYEVQVSTGTGFAAPLAFSAVLDTNEPQVPTTLLVDDKIYYWRVRARLSSGWGPWSAIDSFVIDVS